MLPRRRHVATSKLRQSDTKLSVQDLQEASLGLSQEDRWDATATSVVLQLFLWVGSWGIIDAWVQKVAPDRADQRFLCYSEVAAIGAVFAPILLGIQRWWGPTRRGNTARGDEPTFRAEVLILGFAVALCLCAGLWGMIDSGVEYYAGDDANVQIRWYVVLTLISLAGVAVHHHLYPGHVLDEVGQLTCV